MEVELEVEWWSWRWKCVCTEGRWVGREGGRGSHSHGLSLGNTCKEELEHPNNPQQSQQPTNLGASSRSPAGARGPGSIVRDPAFIAPRFEDGHKVKDHRSHRDDIQPKVKRVEVTALQEGTQNRGRIKLTTHSKWGTSHE